MLQVALGRPFWADTCFVRFDIKDHSSVHSIFVQELSLAARNEVAVGVRALHTVSLAASVSATRTLGFLLADGDADNEGMDPGPLCAV